MKTIGIQTFNEVLDVEGGNDQIDFINVCTPAEYKEKHIEGVRNVPLDEVAQHIDEFSNKSKIYIHCRSGRRGERAAEQLQKLGVAAEVINVEGGILAWEENGYATRSLTTRIPILRQTLLAAGGLVLTSVALYLILGPLALWLAIFVSFGLLIAGGTGWCGMALLLARAPWNR